MNASPPSPKQNYGIAWAIALAVLVFALSQIPYAAAARHTPADAIFLGQIAVADDINSYYSFIRQAALGHVLFRNTMTYMDHAPAFVNVEWLALGRCMGWFHWSPRFAFDVWRAVGIAMLLGAFAALAHVTLPSPFHRRTALIMCALGGGFGWLLTALSKLGVTSVSESTEMLNPALDLYAGIQPFVQMTRNPHFSLPHGTFLLLFMLIILAERTRRPRWYGFAAALTVIHGLIRPYDLISLFAILPAFIVLESIVARRIEWRWNIVRCAPLVLAGPVLLYYVYLFSFHPVFKFWASQGDQPFVPIRWHLLSLGIPFLLFTYRIVRLRSAPLATPVDRLLFVWAAGILVLFHSYKFIPFMPYTPQLGVPLVTPLILLGIAALPAYETLQAPARRSMLAATALGLGINALSTPVYLRQESRHAPEIAQHYFSRADLGAVAWLNNHISENDVVLADYPHGTRMSQFLNARVAVGHWALSPHVHELNPRIDRFLAGELAPQEASALLDGLHPRYIYAPNGNDASRKFLESLGLAKVYDHGGIAVYERPR